VDSGEVDYATCLRRTVGLAVHETGHVFGMPHCIAYSCRMNGSNHLAESDRRPLEYCPECLPKIWWTCNMDPTMRCTRLLQFANEHRLDGDAKLWRGACDRLAAAEKTATTNQR
jgi:archaemetzincin